MILKNIYLIAHLQDFHQQWTSNTNQACEFARRHLENVYSKPEYKPPLLLHLSISYVAFLVERCGQRDSAIHTTDALKLSSVTEQHRLCIAFIARHDWACQVHCIFYDIHNHLTYFDWTCYWEVGLYIDSSVANIICLRLGTGKLFVLMNPKNN